MSAATGSPYAQGALEVFPELLVQMVRAGAPIAAIRAEGFAPRDVDAVAQLVLLADSTEHLDGGDQADRDAQAVQGSVDEMAPVTAPSG